MQQQTLQAIHNKIELKYQEYKNTTSNTTKNTTEHTTKKQNKKLPQEYKTKSNTKYHKKYHNKNHKIQQKISQTIELQKNTTIIPESTITIPQRMQQNTTQIERK